MNNEIDDLINSLKELIGFLNKYGEVHWAKWYEEAKYLLDIRDSKGLEKIMRSFGGMGSINDLVIHPENGHKVSGDLGAINKELMGLISKLYEQVIKIPKFSGKTEVS